MKIRSTATKSIPETSLLCVYILCFCFAIYSISCSSGSGDNNGDTTESQTDTSSDTDTATDSQSDTDSETDTDTEDGADISGIPTFTKGDAVLLEENAIFPGIVYDNTNLYISYGKNNHLFIRAYDENFTALADEIQITTDADQEVGDGVTDHKHIFFQNAHYLLFSTIGDDDLYLIKMDKNLTRVGSIITVTSDSANTRTNDMILGTVGSKIITGQFRPSNLNKNETSGHLIKEYDTSLNQVGSDIVINPFGHANTASFTTFNDTVYFVAPSTPVGAEIVTQRNLLLIRYNSLWTSLDISANVLVDGSTLAHISDGDGIWMSTGSAYDETSNLILVGHTFVNGAKGSDSGVIYFRVFDTSFSEVFSEVMVQSEFANRAHFLLLEDILYVVYDDSTTHSPKIYGLKYTIIR